METVQTQSTKDTCIKDKYSNKSILITGSTGFLGKVVLEKLIRDLPSIKEVYLLIRGNKSYPDALSRFEQEICQSSVFEYLSANEKKSFNHFLNSKIKCITGDITEPHFGLGDNEYFKLVNSVDLIINSAAGVNFREELDTALTINTFAPMNVAQFSNDAGGIPMVHVSTCYVSGFKNGAIKEANNRPPGVRFLSKKNGYFDVKRIIKGLTQKSERIRAKKSLSQKECSEKLVELGTSEAHRYGWNDTYTMTKWLGEQVLIEALHQRTLTIIRPSIIESTLKDPVPGWIEGVKVADALILAYARGKVSFFPANSNGVIDIVPADLVANAIIMGGAEALEKNNQLKIYQVCTGSSNPITMKQFRKWAIEEAKNNYQEYDLLFREKPRKPFIMVNRRVFSAAIKCINYPVSLLSTEKLNSLLSEKQRKVVKNLETTINLANVFSFYTSPICIYHNNNLIELSRKMSKSDQRRFSVDAQNIDWKYYIQKIHIGGLQRYALKKPEDQTQISSSDNSTEVIARPRKVA